MKMELKLINLIEFFPELYNTAIFLKRHLQSFADLWPTLMGFSIDI